MTDPDPVVDAERIVDSGMPVEVARALRVFRAELAEDSVIDVDEACEYGHDFLAHLLATWMPSDGDE